jgi:1,4-alpha-glucan branching enzyme
MSKSKVISIVLSAHLPFVSRPGIQAGPHTRALPAGAGPEPEPGFRNREEAETLSPDEDFGQNKKTDRKAESGALFSCEEPWFFETISETWLPLLAVFDRLDRDRIPFRLSIALSPVLGFMLSDEVLVSRYLEYTDRQIEFGAQELERTAGNPRLYALARQYYDQIVEKRILFTERYEKNILRVLDFYQKKGRLEILTTAATHPFLPLYAPFPEAVQAQMEVAISSHRHFFGRNPQGFWLPELGWSPELDEYLRSYNFSYTVIDTHGALLGKSGGRNRAQTSGCPSGSCGTAYFPAASPGGANPWEAAGGNLPGGVRRGSFYPVKTPSQILVLIRDYHAYRELFEPEGICLSPGYRDYSEDAGYELKRELLEPFLGENGIRMPTGFKYYARSRPFSKKGLYDAGKARDQAGIHARQFLDNRLRLLGQAETLMSETPISLCAFEADSFGRFWHEGPAFLETLFREGAGREGLQFMNPQEYLFKQDIPQMETVMPEFSSWGTNGYAEMWLDSSNDWMYRHVIRSLDRMVELAERFPNDSGLKERALNQAAREILLVQSSDWPRMLYSQESPDFARNQIEAGLRNFTTIYEALGSNYISTEWLTNLERRHYLFPNINYRVFRRKT